MENKNYKVRCVGYNQRERYFTVGKVYEVVNGHITNDNGYKYSPNHEGDAPAWLSRWYKFERVEEHKIVITSDGKTVMARLFNGKELVKKAEAKCSHDDKFDFMVGAELAMERLTDKKPAKPANPFKVGDYVRVTGNTDHYHCFPIGSVGRVTKADPDMTCEVDGFYDGGCRGEQWIPVGCLEKI
jgi:hypothetical protein